MRVLLFIFLAMVSINVVAQDPEYYSYLVKGQVKYKKAKAKPIVLAPKTLLYSEDIIILPKGTNSEITLVDKKSNYITISSPGSYKVADIPRKPHKEPEGITGKYFHLVWEELFQPQKDFSKFKKRNLPGIVGGVSRGDCDVLKWPFNESIIGYGDITFAWRNFGTDPLYTFVLSDEKNDEVLRVRVRDTQLILNSAAWLIGPRNRYYWKVIAINSYCNSLPSSDLRLWSNKEIMQRVNEIKSSVLNNEDPLLYQLKVAELLENENMFEEVNRYYLSVLEQSKDPVVKSAYASFLLRMGREKEAEIVYMK